jgi:hypothetical protein
MLSSNLLGLDQFWTIVRNLEALNEKTTLEDFKTKFDIYADDRIVLEIISFMEKFDYHIKVNKNEEYVLIHPAVDKSEVNIPFSFTDWLALQSCLLNRDNDKPFEILKEKTQNLNEQNNYWDLYKTLEKELMVDNQEETSRQFIIKKLEQANKDNCLAFVKFNDGKAYEIYIHNIIILDGRLSVIAEEVIDRCLISFFITDVLEVSSRPEHTYQANYSPIQVEDFIAGMRAVIDNEERLVLKIYNPEKVNLNPPYHFLGSPYITSNSSGDYIWAASVEVSDELFSWLKMIKDDVEIIDPEPIKKEFEKYLENSSNNELKKAS